MLQWHLISRHLLQVWTAWDCSLPFTCNSAAHSSLYLLLPQRKPFRPHQWQVTLLYPVRCAVHLMSVSAASCVVHLTTSLAPSHCCSVRIISELLWNFTKLVSWRSYPCQPQRITSGLKTNFNLSPCYSSQKSLNHKFLFLKPQLKILSTITERKARQTKRMFWTIEAYLYSVATQHGNLNPAVTYFLLRAHTGTHVSHS